ncbi:heavy metal translocating P-type ATPase [Alkalihalobacillus sp. MEB130]|uniref:heavy metal translocating P-type ATPase n=1 Tax=Alkalihalobacillus sp. MEB130 TaxID=2976704 RepID=UPI0028DFF0FC|nr:heavy metal translocating P-type ATPase [Alkalihalobacillus sp. MEB130]MDT8859547.1 heavy metal translocating P-type ATPase [Alkalihalobacillus sp. MEB130]
MSHENKYLVQGFTCANCAAQFERNVQKLSGVESAEVNFQASTITVIGDVTKKEVEKEGAFENLKLYKEDEQIVQSSKWRSSATWKTILSGLLLLSGFIVHGTVGEGFLAILFYASSMAIGGYRLFVQGLKNLTQARFDMKTLMTIAVIGAAIIGEWGEGATVVFLFAISQMLETYSMDRARRSISSLFENTPKKARTWRDGSWRDVHVKDLAVGEKVMIRPGEKVTVDGIVKKGVSSINQAAITGESIPVEKQVGDTVFAGTLNEDGQLEVEITKRNEDSTLSKMLKLVEEAQAKRASAEAFIDRFAKVYTPIIIAIAIVVSVVPPIFFQGEWSSWIYQGLAVLVVGCPCALVISTPVSIVTALGTAARHGVLIKGGIHLEEAGRVDAVAFDKTGTLTKGKPEVTNMWVSEQTTENEFLNVMASLEQNSKHPLALAILTFIEGKMNTSLEEVTDFYSETGKGVTGTINKVSYFVGSVGYINEVTHMSDEVISQVQQFKSDGKTVVLLATSQNVIGMLALADSVRDESIGLMKALHNMGIRNTILLTGDHEKSAQMIANEVGMTNIKANLLPDEKVNYVKALREGGAHVAMVGDGVNDAAALATANVGIAMGGAGSDVALETADIVFMKDDLSKLPFTVLLSRKAKRVIKQNITLSLLLKLLALSLVIPGWLTLWIAIIADMGATLLVTLNGLRLLKIKKN